MTKQDIIRKLEKRTGFSLSQATHAVEGVIEIFSDALANDETILLRGFGTIKTVQRAARPARDINKGTQVMVPPTKQVKFIAYDALKERINTKKQ